MIVHAISDLDQAIDLSGELESRLSDFADEIKKADKALLEAEQEDDIERVRSLIDDARTHLGRIN